MPRARRVDERPRLSRARARGLLAGPPLAQRGDGPGEVHPVGERQVDGVDVGPGEKDGVGRARHVPKRLARERVLLRHAVLCGKGRGTPGGAAADGHKLGVRLVREASCEAVGYAPRADDAPSGRSSRPCAPFSAA